MDRPFSGLVSSVGQMDVHKWSSSPNPLTTIVVLVLPVVASYRDGRGYTGYIQICRKLLRGRREPDYV